MGGPVDALFVYVQLECDRITGRIEHRRVRTRKLANQSGSIRARGEPLALVGLELLDVNLGSMLM